MFPILHSYTEVRWRSLSTRGNMRFQVSCQNSRNQRSSLTTVCLKIIGQSVNRKKFSLQQPTGWKSQAARSGLRPWCYPSLLGRCSPSHPASDMIRHDSTWSDMIWHDLTRGKAQHPSAKPNIYKSLWIIVSDCESLRFHTILSDSIRCSKSSLTNLADCWLASAWCWASWQRATCSNLRLVSPRLRSPRFFCHGTCNSFSCATRIAARPAKWSSGRIWKSWHKSADTVSGRFLFKLSVHRAPSYASDILTQIQSVYPECLVRILWRRPCSAHRQMQCINCNSSRAHRSVCVVLFCKSLRLQ